MNSGTRNILKRLMGHLLPGGFWKKGKFKSSRFIP